MITTVLMGVSHHSKAQEIVQEIVEELNSKHQCVELEKGSPTGTFGSPPLMRNTNLNGDLIRGQEQ